MVEWSGKEMECLYEDEALKFVDKVSPVILDAASVSKMPVNHFIHAGTTGNQGVNLFYGSVFKW
jgi:hypothetical protein